MAAPLWKERHQGTRAPCPPFPITQERFNELARKVVSGEAALVGPDEMWEEPADEGVWTRLRNAFTSDPWRAVVERAMAGRPFVRTEALEQALRAENLIEKALSAKDHGRLLRLMSRLGWVKTNVTENGGPRFKAFAPKASK
jgi:hypothetical protein